VVCTAIPGTCSMLSDPVCGCDGQLYHSECFAERARVGWHATVGGCP
jgi:hypothetical protein